MYQSIRSTLLITAFAATVAAALTAAFPGETREVNVAETCAHAAWPEIPAGCLDGGKGRDVRYVTANKAADDDMATRFAAAFE
jgi:hypothetical protein